VNKYLSDWETLLLFATLDDEDNYRPNLQFNEKIMKEMDKTFTYLCQELKINWKKDKFVDAMSSPRDSASVTFDVSLVLNLENLCNVLAKYDHASTLYAVGHGVRRLRYFYCF
jgi:peptidoglycan/xylan/chitin deacetylase (PgdA/CDA1 family)